MENIGASVSEVLTHKKKERGEQQIEEKEYIQKKNEMIFCLRENPEYQISAVAEWCENAQGSVVMEADTYFLHTLTGRRCESAWGCLVGWSEQDEKSTEKWETLCRYIEELENLEEIVCVEKKVGL